MFHVEGCRIEAQEENQNFSRNRVGLLTHGVTRFPTYMVRMRGSGGVQRSHSHQHIGGVSSVNNGSSSSTSDSSSCHLLSIHCAPGACQHQCI